ncbi:Ribonuclease H domain [Sesbania bispinosa]|nr:Ribonuclease H domain [Sesbania bispinosa]
MELFREFLRITGLMDMDLSGCKFTWIGGNRDGCTLMEKIDRILTTWGWRALYPHAEALAIPSFTSDHSPVILFCHPKDSRDDDFKFEAYWTDNQECKKVIDGAWSSGIDAENHWDLILKKTKAYKNRLLSWSHKTFKKPAEEIFKLKQELAKLSNGPFDEEVRKRRREIKLQIDLLWQQEEKYWGQRSRLKWLKFRDKNTQFFHATTIQRRGRNRIMKIQDAQGAWQEGTKDILKAVESQYRSLFTTSPTDDSLNFSDFVPNVISQEINSVLEAIPSAADIQNAFWWSKLGKSSGMHWRKWTDITKAKRVGGIGFKEFELMNIAHLAKQAWRVYQNPDSLWVKILKGIYFPDCDFLRAKKKRGSSWAWSSLILGKDFLISNGRWIIGNGSNIDLWGGDHSLEWDPRKVADHFPRDQAETILKIPLSTLRGQDRLCWPYSPHGEYTVKIGYQIAKASTDSGPLQGDPHMQVFWKNLWSIPAPQKIKLFLWKAASKSLPVRGALHRRHLAQSPLCPICSQEEESIDHLFLRCDWTRAFWFAGHPSLSPSSNPDLRFKDWLREKLSLLKDLGDQSASTSTELAFSLWNIWKARNNVVFKDDHVNIERVISRNKEEFSEYIYANSPTSQANPTSNLARERNTSWRPPRPGVYKLNVDAAFNQGSGLGATTVIVRNADGHLLTTTSSRISVHSPLEAEAHALRGALQLARNLQCHHILCESDSLTLIEVIREDKELWSIANYLKDIQALRREFLSYGFLWTHRSANEAAHLLAAHSLHSSAPQAVLWNLPPDVLAAVARDRQPRASPYLS